MLIHLDNVSKVYKEKDFEVPALRNITLDIEKGEMVAIMGASGSGKSTLLNILGCLDKPTSGGYYLENQEISTYTEKQMAKLRNEVFGFVLQDFVLVERYTVAKNVELPLYYSKKFKKQRQERVDEILKQVGIVEKKNQLALKLSGGQRQRVAIARGLVNDAKIVLCDEPTGALDQKNTQNIMDILIDLNKRGKTVIIVTHDAEVAKQCSRVIYIEDGVL